MTVEILEALEEEWSVAPPTNWLVAGFMGYKKKKRGTPADLAAMFPGGTIK